MHLSPVEATIVLLVLPIIATTWFWRSQILRRYRVARWLLAPFVYLGVAALGVIVGITFGWYTDIGSSRAQYAVKLEDWQNHPDVKEVRAIQTAISNGIKNKKYMTNVRRFRVESPRCPEPYPMISETLYTDARNRVVLYHVVQMGSDEESFTIDRYYDANGMLRFFFLDRVLSNVRIYFDRNGKQFWAVDQNRDKFTVSQGWETAPDTASAAQKAFREQQPCPELLE